MIIASDMDLLQLVQRMGAFGFEGQASLDQADLFREILLDLGLEGMACDDVLEAVWLKALDRACSLCLNPDGTEAR